MLFYIITETSIKGKGRLKAQQAAYATSS